MKQAYQTYIYSVTSRITRAKDTVRVWSDCETVAFKAVSDAYSSTHEINGYTTSPKRFIGEIDCS